MEPTSSSSRLDQDTIGPMGFTVHDVALLLGIMAGYDERDNLSSSTVTPVQAARRDDFDTAATIPTVTPKDYTTFTQLPYADFKDLVIGVPHKHFLDHEPDRALPDVHISKTALESALAKMDSRGARIKKPIDVAMTDSEMMDHNRNWVSKISADFREELEVYLAELHGCKIRTMEDLVNFNDLHPVG
jgi:Asp-tRNA(Asn)/Glu-tRNA(Gln) amidotransferase A subunit family amidase